MDFERKLHVVLRIFVKDRDPKIQELRPAFFHESGRGLRIKIEVFPKRRAHEAGDDRNPEVLCGRGSEHHLLAGPFADLVGLSTVFLRAEIIQAGVVVVANTLTEHVRGDSPGFQIIFCKERIELIAVGLVGSGAGQIDDTAAERHFKTVITDLTGHFADVLQRHVGKLSDAECNGLCHMMISFLICVPSALQLRLRS